MEALRIFDLKSAELRHKTGAELILVMNHVVTYFGPKECLSNQKRYICYKMDKPRKFNTRQYVVLVLDINLRMAHIPPLFDENQKLDESELVDSLANKALRIYKAMLISQGFNPETGDLAKFVEHCERVKTTNNIAIAKFSSPDGESDTKRHKKRSNTKEPEENGKKLHNKNSSFYCSLRGEKNSHTSRESNTPKKKKDKDNPK